MLTASKNIDLTKQKPLTKYQDKNNVCFFFNNVFFFLKKKKPKRINISRS